MNILNPSTTHPSLWHVIIRFFKILKRYGLSSKKMQSNMKLYLAILKKYGVRPSFSITAKVLSKHPKLINKQMKKGIEFAVHGYRHIDYSRLSEEETLRHLEKAVKIFQEHDIPFFGFRFPYLRYNNKGTDILGRFFCWDSSHTILWNGLKKTEFGKRNWRNYETSLNQYNYKNSDNRMSLPRFRNNILELPLSLPDDDLLIDRLRIKDEEILFKIWSEILGATYIRGELLVLQFHPERIPIFRDPLKSILQTAKELYPKVWISSLSDIYEWWKEKESFTVQLNCKGNWEYEVDVSCSPRAVLLMRSNYLEKEQFYNGFGLIRERTFSVKSPKCPIIGIPKDSSPELLHFLKNEGFISEISEQKEKYSLYLDNFTNFSEEDEMKALETIHTSNFPLIRFWRWPDNCKSCLSVTGDIDSITLYDFFDR